jgi:hypothetical protein
VGFVVVASLALVSMFFLLQLGMFWVIRVVQVFFCVGCVSALFHFCAFPLVHALQPRCARRGASGRGLAACFERARAHAAGSRPFAAHPPSTRRRRRRRRRRPPCSLRLPLHSRAQARAAAAAQLRGPRRALDRGRHRAGGVGAAGALLLF